MRGVKRSRRGKDNGDLRRLLGRAELPTIPALVGAAIDRVSDPDCDLRDVAEIVGRDPGLSARLLSVVNSAAYAPRNPILGVAQAVAMFGRNHLESMLISLAASRIAGRVAAPGFDLNRFWTVAAWRASAAGGLSRIVDRSRSSENFSAALLEDIAVPILASTQARYPDVLEAWRRGHGDLAELEKRAFGWTHTEVAGWLFDEWGFPIALREAVTEIGQPEEAHVRYPVVRLVSPLAAPRDADEVAAEVADRIHAVFEIPHPNAVELLAVARSDATVLAGSLT